MAGEGCVDGPGVDEAGDTVACADCVVCCGGGTDIEEVTGATTWLVLLEGADGVGGGGGWRSEPA